MTFPPPDTTVPEPALICLIGAAGSGKSTLASTWHLTQVLSLDHYRALVSDDPGDQDATADAADVLKLILERRMACKLNTVIDATNAERALRSYRFDFAIVGADRVSPEAGLTRRSS
ncbi:AAA family ATPase [Streptomyces litmocidini]|uniref:AAA family ATPase n=1 Tax=Streptomyces litmocidini TaxID=67318 RepID=UPI003700D2D9